MNNDTPIYQPFGVPKQSESPGWGWESAGVAGALPNAPMYSEQERGSPTNYFGNVKMNVSAEMTYPNKRLT